MKRRAGRTGLQGLLGLLNLHHTARLFWALFRDRRVSLWLKISAVSGMIYFFSPLDVVPDYITGIGLLDDIIMALLIMQSLVELAPRHVVNEHCERLKIDPERVFVNVPATVRDAVELFDWAMERTGGPPGYRGRRGREEPWGRGYGPEEQPVQEQGRPREQPPYSRYSAFEKDKDVL
jgi:uncharacterized membrane protein YkvA (DUF1232 family)